MLIKKSKASVLVVSLIIMGMVLIASLSVALVAVKERRASIGASKTGVTFQSADSAVEKVLNDIAKGGHTKTSELVNCAAGIITYGDVKVSLLDINGALISCNTETSLGDVAKLKAVAVGTQTGRAIEADVDTCIKTCEELQAIHKPSVTITGYYCLDRNIDCSKTDPLVGGSIWGVNGFNPIGIGGGGFDGIFDGRGYKIKDLYINRADNSIGLFSRLENNARVHDLILENLDIKGELSVGGLAGGCDGSCEITNVRSSGDIKGKTSIGGIVGDTTEASSSAAKISSSIFNGTVTSTFPDTKVGGIVGGACEGTLIENCYSSGIAKGKAYIGGIIGSILNSNPPVQINDSYSAMKIEITNPPEANVGGVSGDDNDVNISDTFWDTTVSDPVIRGCGWADPSCDAQGKATNFMQTASTYSGWDDNIWKLETGAYPCLLWDTDNCSQ